MRRRVVLAKAFILLVVLSSTAGTADVESRLLSATYEPGGTCDDCYGWRASVSQAGVAVLEAKTTPGWNAPDTWRPSRGRQLSKRQLANLNEAIEKARFMSLSPHYS